MVRCQMTNDFPNHLTQDVRDAIFMHLRASCETVMQDNAAWLRREYDLDEGQAANTLWILSHGLDRAFGIMENPEPKLLCELGWELEIHNDAGRVVVFDNGQYPTGIASYRGFYNHAAIGYSPDPAKALAQGPLVSAINNAMGGEFDGYKGGTYKFTHRTPVWAANWGETTEVKVVGVRYEQRNKCVLITAPERE